MTWNSGGFGVAAAVLEIKKAPRKKDPTIQCFALNLDHRPKYPNSESLTP